MNQNEYVTFFPRTARPGFMTKLGAETVPAQVKCYKTLIFTRIEKFRPPSNHPKKKKTYVSFHFILFYYVYNFYLYRSVVGCDIYVLNEPLFVACQCLRYN